MSELDPKKPRLTRTRTTSRGSTSSRPPNVRTRSRTSTGDASKKNDRQASTSSESKEGAVRTVNKTVIVKDKDGNQRRVVRKFIVKPDGTLVKPSIKSSQTKFTNETKSEISKTISTVSKRPLVVPSRNNLNNEERGELRRSSTTNRSANEMRQGNSASDNNDNEGSSLKTKSAKDWAGDVLAEKKKAYRRSNEKTVVREQKNSKGMLLIVLGAALVVAAAGGYFYISQKNKAYIQKFQDDLISIRDKLSQSAIETSNANLETLNKYRDARKDLFTNVEVNATNELKSKLDIIEKQIKTCLEFKKNAVELKLNENSVGELIGDYYKLVNSNIGIEHVKIKEIEKEIETLLTQKYEKVWKEKFEIISELSNKNISDFLYIETEKYLTDEKENFGKIDFGEHSKKVNSDLDELLNKVKKNKTVYEEFITKISNVNDEDAEKIRSNLVSIVDEAKKLDPEFNYIRDMVVAKSDRITENLMHLYRAEYKSLLEKGILKSESEFIKDKGLKKKSEIPEFVEAKEDELKNIGNFFKSGLPNSGEIKIETTSNNFSIPFEDGVLLGGLVKAVTGNAIQLYFKGMNMQIGSRELNPKALPKGGDYNKYFLNYFLKAAYKYSLNPPQKSEPIVWYKNPMNIRMPGFMLFGKGDTQQYVLLNDIIFEQSGTNFNVEAQRKEGGIYKSKIEKLINEINTQYADKKEIANPVVLLLEGLLKPLDPNNQISTQFANLVFKSGYLKSILPNISDDLSKLVTETEKYYEENIDIERLMWYGEATDGSEVEYFFTYSGKSIIVLFDATKNETTFLGVPYVSEMNLGYTDTSYAVVSKGKLNDRRRVNWPKNEDVVRYETYHFNGERLALYDVVNQKFFYDNNVWEQYIMDPRNLYPMHGAATWRHPPHVLMINKDLGVDGIIVPNGTIKLVDLSSAKNEVEMIPIMDTWLDDIAKKMPLTGELHLLFRYLFKYTFDSPIPNMNNLIGNNRDRGDFHQTVYQTLERKLNDKMLCDCDDLAEVYANIIRRQNKNSFVFGVPGHATCGWVEKKNDGKFTMTFLDTGVPRKFTASTLDEAVRLGVDSYDKQNIVDFNPRSVHFLLRFAGEQVRQGYYLDSKVLIDDNYGQKMVDVQEGWHFHYYLQSMAIMEEITKNDSISANYFEISGLHREMGDFKNASKYFKMGLDKLDPKDKKGYLQNYINYSNMLFKSDKTKIPEYLVTVQKLMNDLEKEGGGKEMLHQRFRLANILLSEKKASEAFDLIKDDLKNPHNINMSFISTLTAIQNVIKEQKEAQTDKEKEVLKTVSDLIENFINKNLFTQQDDIRMNIVKYSIIYSQKVNEYGFDECLKKLLVKEYPKDINIKHFDRRKVNEEEDWKWIRLNIQNYYGAMLNALKTEDKNIQPTEEQWKKAFELNDYLETAYSELKKQGVSANFEYNYLIILLFEAAKKKDWAKVDEIFGKMQKEEWTVFYRMVTKQVGYLCVYLPESEFLTLVKKFFDHKPPKQHFLEIAYDCLGAGKYDLCLKVAKMALSYFPDDQKIKKEVELLEPYLNTRRSEK